MANDSAFRSKVPVEVQEYILLFLSDKELCSFRSVSRRWLHVYDLFEPSVLAPEQAHHNAVVFMCHRSMTFKQSVGLKTKHERKRLLSHCATCRTESEAFRAVAELASRPIEAQCVQLRGKAQKMLDTCLVGVEEGHRALQECRLQDVAELKGLYNPPPEVLQIGCCYVMMVERRWIDPTKLESWVNVQRLLGQSNKVVQIALHFDRDDPLPSGLEDTIRGIILGPEAERLEAKARNFSKFAQIQLLWLRGVLQYFPVRREVEPIRHQLMKREQILQFAHEVHQGLLGTRYGDVGTYVGGMEKIARDHIKRQEQEVAKTNADEWSNIQMVVREARIAQSAVPPASKLAAPSTGKEVKAPHPKGRVPLTLHQASFPTTATAIEAKKLATTTTRTSGSTLSAKKKK